MRLALMDEPLRRVLGLAAAVGATEISLSQLRAGAAALEPPVDIPVLFDALDRALRLRLLEERGEGYAFRHPVVRAALYDCLPRHRRDELRAALTAPGDRRECSIDRLPGFLLSSKFLRPSSKFGGTAGRVLECPHSQSGRRKAEEILSRALSPRRARAAVPGHPRSACATSGLCTDNSRPRRPQSCTRSNPNPVLSTLSARVNVYDHTKHGSIDRIPGSTLRLRN